MRNNERLTVNNGAQFDANMTKMCPNNDFKIDKLGFCMKNCRKTSISQNKNRRFWEAAV